jgi:hypothetical protein
VTPRFSLEEVKEAAREDRLRLGGSRCQEHLLQVLSTLLECREFAASVAQELSEGDYSQTVEVGSDAYDEYGVRLPEALLERFGLEGRATWYVKLTLRRERGGTTLFFLSLHALERPMHRRGGTLQPGW